jgi:transcriptional regulator with XRE-family HTH domain
MPRGNRQAQQVDIEVGQRIKALRISRGLSQGELGAAIDVSFQQIQKYEKGNNRIGPGRLTAIAAALKTPVATFYGVDKSGASVPVEIQLNTHTRRKLIETLDRIASPRFESVLLAMAMEHAAACGARHT